MSLKDFKANRKEHALTQASHCLSIKGIAQCLLMHEVDGSLASWCRGYLEAVTKQDMKLQQQFEQRMPEEIDNIWKVKQARSAFWSGATDTPCTVKSH